MRTTFRSLPFTQLSHAMLEMLRTLICRNYQIGEIIELIAGNTAPQTFWVGMLASRHTKRHSHRHPQK